MITLTYDENPQVRAAAGSSLLTAADDDAAWSNTERLVRDDDVVTVREQIAASLASDAFIQPRLRDGSRC